MRVQTKVGDIFAVAVDGQSKKYFQYVGNDKTQLNSDIIRAFKRRDPIATKPDLSDVVNGEVEFYAHCIIGVGLKLGVWVKVGTSGMIGDFANVLFRHSNDYGNPQIKVSSEWWIWEVSKPQIKVGRLEGDHKNAEIGLVFNPKQIEHRMKTGEYNLKGFPD